MSVCLFDWSLGALGALGVRSVAHHPGRLANKLQRNRQLAGIGCAARRRLTGEGEPHTIAPVQPFGKPESRNRRPRYSFKWYEYHPSTTLGVNNTEYGSGMARYG